MSKHTPEPWTVEESCVKGWGWDIPELPDADYRDSRFRFEADARRVVACVNACAGMEDPEKEIWELRNSCLYRDMAVARAVQEACSFAAFGNPTTRDRIAALDLAKIVEGVK